jgi:hypothetical protein
MKYIFYLPKLDKEVIICAKDESCAVWKLLQQYRLVENHIDDFQIRKEEKNV